MPATDPIALGAHVMTVCNACRYCEQYCPVFPAMEQRRVFDKADLLYLANLCHNCGECLYACQYAPPHEFGINVPGTFAEIRLQSYKEHCWPRALGAAFKTSSVVTGVSLAVGLTALMLLAAVVGGSPLWQSRPVGDFYSVIPYPVMVALFGGVGAFVVAALWIGVRRFSEDVRGSSRPTPSDAGRHALRDALTLRHLHATGVDCTTAEEVRSPWRRWWHHATFYGFMLCFASTSVAAIYHDVFGWRAPYGYLTLPVVLGTLGGTALVAGTIGLLALGRRRDPALGGASTRGLDDAFLVLLLLASVTGLALLMLRNQPVMGILLVVHLGVVLALFVTLPYGKFVHGFYRLVALKKFHSEQGSG